MITELGIILFAVFVLICVRFLIPSKGRQRKVPRGPLLRLPIVGHLLMLGSQPQKTLLKWRGKYGPMFRIQLGSFETVVINDGHLIRKAFTSPALSGRPRTPIYDAMGSGRTDLALSDGPHVEELRQFFRENFRVFSASPTQPIEHRILSEAENFISKMRAMGDTPLFIHGFFHTYVVNSILAVVTGLKCPPGDKMTEYLQKQVQELSEIRGLIEFLAMFIPKLCDLAPSLSGLKRRESILDAIHCFFRGIVDTHKQTFVHGQPRDILDAYLDKGEEEGEGKSTFSSQAGHLLPFLFDMFSAGMETTSTQMEWIIYYMVKHPEIQAKIHDEIDNFIGAGRVPCLKDRTSLVFTEAAIQEALRIASLFPLGLFHSALENCEINGYHIPKDTVIIGNLYAAHHDPLVWGDPETFRPDRFIDPASGRLKRCEDLVPFSWGKRKCIGEELARQELFLFTVSILQQFVVRSAEKLPPEEGFGITVAPMPFKVILHLRT